MKIKVKIGTVEIEYSNETSDSYCEPASTIDGYSSKSDRESLMRTIAYIVREAKEAYESVNR